jgi:hypothetical protein
MPLPIPVLDDRRFHDLVEEARALIPTHAPGWTNHNPSDPGITLIELFAYLAEALIYRLDQVTPETLCAFLDLLDGSAEREPEGGSSRVRVTRREPAGPVESVHDLDVEVRETVLRMRRQDRAVTALDYERLAREPDALPPALHGKLKQLRCCPGLDLRTQPATPRADHVSLVATMRQDSPEDWPVAVHSMEAWMEPRRMLGTQFHMVGPLSLRTSIEIRVLPDTREMREAVGDAVDRWLDPVSGGDDSQGWPFGRGVYRSELYVFIASLPGVTEVRTIVLDCEQPARLLSDTGHGHEPEVVGVRPEPHEFLDAAAWVNMPATKPWA